MARGKTYNATPSFAYQLNNWLSIGAGVQIERARADFSSGLPVNNAGNPAGTDVDVLPQIANRRLRREKAGGDAGLFRLAGMSGRGSSDAAEFFRTPR